jgi:ribose transport system substrate-binding protein
VGQEQLAENHLLIQFDQTLFMKINPPHAIMKKLCLLLPTLGLLAVLAGCDNKTSGPASSAPPKKLRLAFVPNSASEYWSVVQLGCTFAAKQLGDVEVEFPFPAERTAKAQQEILSDLVARGVDGIAISPIDADSQTDFLNGIAARTLLVCADSDAAASKRAGYIGSDNVAAGNQVAQLLKTALPQGGKVVLLVGYPNAQNTKDRVQGIQAGLAGSNLEIVDTLSDDHKSPIASKNAQDALTKHAGLAAMVGIYSYHGPAILTAVRSAGKAGQVKIVCFDEDSDTLDGIVAGDIYGTIVQKPLMIGSQTIRRMGEYLRGDKTQLAGGKILLPFEALTTKEQVEAFRTLRKGMLQPDEHP